MCRITEETIKRASERMMSQQVPDMPTLRSGEDGIVVSTRYGGKTYKQSISVKQLTEAYGKALGKSKKYGTII